MNEVPRQKRIGRTAGLGLLCGAAFLAAVPFAGTALAGASATNTTGSTSTVTETTVDEKQTRHECWESTLADTESGSEELRAIADALNDCGGPWSSLVEIFDGDDDSEASDSTTHNCWESTLADTESGSEELDAIADAFENCGEP